MYRIYAKKVKKPRQPFIFFSCKYRKDLMKEMLAKGEPMVPFPEVSKRAGEIWRNFSDEEKKPFYKLAEKDKERFHKEVQLRMSGHKAEEVHVSMAEHPPSAFQLFEESFKKETEANQEAEVDVPTLAKEMWEDMPDELRKPYVEKEEALLGKWQNGEAVQE